MSGGVFYTLPFFQLKGNLQPSSQFLVCFAEKIVDVARPASIRDQSVDPARIIITARLLLVIHHVIGKYVTNHLCPAKHQQAGQADALGTVMPLMPICANPGQKLVGWYVSPYVTWF